MPTSDHLILGKVYDADGDLLAGATIQITVNGETLSIDSNSSGEYIINLKNLPFAWQVRDSMSIVASKTYFGKAVTTLIVTSEAAQELDLTLEYISDLIPKDNQNILPTNATVILDFEGNKITPANPLPVQAINTGDIDLLNNPSTVWDYGSRTDGQPEYEEVIVRGVTYRRTFTYNAGGQIIARSAWVKQS